MSFSSRVDKLFTCLLYSLVKYFSTLEQRLCIFTRPCNILYRIPTCCKSFHLKVPFAQVQNLIMIMIMILPLWSSASLSGHPVMLLLLSSYKLPFLAEKCECNWPKDYSFPRSKETMDWKRVWYRVVGMQDEPFSPLGYGIQGIGGRREVGCFCVAEWQLLIFSCGKWHVRWLKSG